MSSIVSEEWMEKQRRAIRLEKTRRTEGLPEFYARVSRNLTYPHWLQEFADLFEQVELAWHGKREPVRAILSVPPQHGKSFTASHGLSWLLSRNPSKESIIVSYGATLAEQHATRCRGILDRAGVPLEYASTKQITTQAGGAIVAAGIGGGITGKPISGLGLIDDPHKNYAETKTKLQRDKVWDWYQNDWLQRLHPTASQIVIQTRWHPDDLAGRLIEQGGWDNICLKAIDDDGEALWPEERPVEWLLSEKKAKMLPHMWESLFQGNPRVAEDVLFKEPTYYELSDEPRQHFRLSAGVDLAYTAKKSSDWSVMVVMKRDMYDRIFVVDVIRERVEVSDFASLIKQACDRYSVTPRFDCSGAEQGVADLMRGFGVNLSTNVVRADKFQRAQAFSQAWNAGQILVPRGAKWVRDFVDELCSFTGQGDRHDDQVDAAVSAFESLPSATSKPIQTVKRRYSDRSGRHGFM